MNLIWSWTNWVDGFPASNKTLRRVKCDGGAARLAQAAMQSFQLDCYRSSCCRLKLCSFSLTHSLTAAAAQFRCIWVSAVVLSLSAWVLKPRCCLIKLMDVGELKLNCQSLNNRWTARVSLLLICITISLIRFPLCSSFFSLFPSCSSDQMLTGCKAYWSELENKLTPSAVEMLVCEFASLKIKGRFSCVKCN